MPDDHDNYQRDRNMFGVSGDEFGGRFERKETTLQGEFKVFGHTRKEY